MAKKWKAYPWPDRVGEPTIEVTEDDEEIDVVGDSPANQKQATTSSTCWGPSSPTAGATAPSPPPHSPEAATKGSTILYNGKSHTKFFLLNIFGLSLNLKSLKNLNKFIEKNILTKLS